MKFRPTGRDSRDMFVLSCLTALLMLFTSHTFSDIWAWAVTLTDIALCVFVVGMFRSEALSEALYRKYSARAAERRRREQAAAAEEARARRAHNVSFPVRRHSDSGSSFAA